MASFSHVFLTIFLLCFSIPAIKSDLIRNTCVHVNQQYDGTDVNDCIKFLSSEPTATKATNLIDLTLGALLLGEKTAHQIVARINGTLASNKLCVGLKPVLTIIRNQFMEVELSFYWALGIVNRRGDFDDADYSIATMTDHFTIIQNEINKVKGKIDSFYQSSVDVLRALRNIGRVLIDEADPHSEE